MNPDPTTGRMIATTFYYKETAWGKGYRHDNVTGSITVQPNSTGRITEQNIPEMDPVKIVLKKQGADEISLQELHHLLEHSSLSVSMTKISHLHASF